MIEAASASEREEAERKREGRRRSKKGSERPKASMVGKVITLRRAQGSKGMGGSGFHWWDEKLVVINFSFIGSMVRVSFS